MDDQCAGHSHDGHTHDDDISDGLGLSLRTYVDIPNVTCFNETVLGAGQSIIKLHEERMTETPSLLSPSDDPELLLYIPFTEAVVLQSISILNSSKNRESSSPRRMKLFVNRDDLDFETARELPAQQEMELLPHSHFEEGTIDYPCRPAGRFHGITSLTIYFFENDNDEEETATEITFVGLKGKGTNMKRMAVTAVYETQAMPEDHKVKGGHFGSPNII